MNAAASKIRQWRERPVVFVREVLQLEPDAWQVDVLEGVSTNRRVCLKASKGPGKTALLAMIGWWFLATRLHPKVICTSITEDNLRDGLWSEMSKFQQRSAFLSETFTWSAERIVANDHPQTWFASARTWPKTANTQEQAKTLAGIHADNVLFLLDEAGGIPDAVVATAEAGLANVSKEANREAILVLAGNPTNLDGPLYRACTRERALWFVKEISGDPDDPKRAPRVSVEWARQQIAKYGRDNPWVLVNVFGRFPPGSIDTLLGVEEVSEATRRTLAPPEYSEEVKVLGLDCARFGDDRSVLFPRQGRAAFKPKVFRNLNTMDLASQTALVINKWQPDATFVDVASFGAGVVDRLHQLGFPVIGVDFGGKALKPRYFNRRAEMWCEMADWLKGGGCIPDDAELIAELVAPKYWVADENKLQLEKKKDVKKRLGLSPDLADGLALTFAAPVAHKDIHFMHGARGRTVEHEYDPYDRGD